MDLPILKDQKLELHMNRHYFINRSRRKEDLPKKSGEFYSPSGYARGTRATNRTDSTAHTYPDRLRHLRPSLSAGCNGCFFTYLDHTQIVLC